MAALPQILSMLVPLGALLYARERVESRRSKRAVMLGLTLVWLYAAYEAVALSAFLLLTPSGIGEDNWPELWVSLLVTLALPAWLLLRSARAR